MAVPNQQAQRPAAQPSGTPAGEIRTERLNVYQKLALARDMFVDKNVKPSGINRRQEFQYFELGDIVPYATKIGREIGLAFITDFTEEVATMTVINTDKTDDRIIFHSPMRQIEPIISKEGRRVMNDMQMLGSVETYQRRYLYMMALDIVEHDLFDAQLGENTVTPAENLAPRKAPAKGTTGPTQPRPQKDEITMESTVPVTAEERQNIKEQLTAETGKAEELQLQALNNLMKRLLEVDPSQEDTVQAILIQTDRLRNITKRQCSNLMEEIKNMIDEAERAAKGEE